MASSQKNSHRFSQFSQKQSPFFIGVGLILLGTLVLGGLAWGVRRWQAARNNALTPATLELEPQWKLELDPTATAPAVAARAYWIYERSSGSLLAAQDANSATAAASLAKLMTAAVSYDVFPLETVLTVGSASAVPGNRAKLGAQESYRVYDLLQALLVFSANDAAETLAQGHPQGREAFIEAMNRRAEQLKLHNTHFENPTGLDGPEQYSSAADIGALTDHILSIPSLSQIVAKSVTTIEAQQTRRPTTVYTTNALLNRDPRFQGVKTGTTEQAGENLIVRYVDPEASSAATPNGQDIIVVVLGSTQRYTDTPALIRWVQSAARPILRQSTLE